MDETYHAQTVNDDSRAAARTAVDLVDLRAISPRLPTTALPPPFGVGEGTVQEVGVGGEGIEESSGLAAAIILWDSPTMTVTVDSKRRVVLPTAKPGELFDVQWAGDGRLVLTRMEPVEPRQAKVRIEVENGLVVGVLDGPINEQALRESLADFP